MLERIGYIGHQAAASGGGSYVVKNEANLRELFERIFPAQEAQPATAVGNVAAFRNSKAARRESQKVVLLRGLQQVSVNGIDVDLAASTGAFGTFCAVLHALHAPKVCFVENLDVYLIAEQVIGNDYTFVHTYGGLSKAVTESVTACDILVFPDYDFVGLSNYLRIKSVAPTARLFVPDDYDELFETKSRPIKTTRGREQRAAPAVADCAELDVVRIRTSIYNHRRFLEQQALFK